MCELLVWQHCDQWLLGAVIACGTKRWYLFRLLVVLTVQLHPDVTGLGYWIPRGGMYELISCPNYLGETIEWIGYAITTGSLVGTAFAFYTFANLAPRAHQHHQWYQETFPDYPVNRKAYIPFIW